MCSLLMSVAKSRLTAPTLAGGYWPELARLKKGEISDEGDFVKAAEENFTPYYKPMVPWVNRLRKVVFPNGRRWENEDSGLYTRMREILGEAGKAVADR